MLFTQDLNLNVADVVRLHSRAPMNEFFFFFFMSVQTHPGCVPVAGHGGDPAGLHV